jgi:hypothetical protein
VSRVVVPCASFELPEIVCRERRVAYDLPTQESANLAQCFCIVAAERDAIFRLKRDNELVVVPAQSHTSPRLVQHGVEGWIVRLAHQPNFKADSWEDPIPLAANSIPGNLAAMAMRVVDARIILRLASRPTRSRSAITRAWFIHSKRPS